MTLLEKLSLYELENSAFSKVRFRTHPLYVSAFKWVLLKPSPFSQVLQANLASRKSSDPILIFEESSSDMGGYSSEILDS